jgi:Methyltransferase domain
MHENTKRKIQHSDSPAPTLGHVPPFTHWKKVLKRYRFFRALCDRTIRDSHRGRGSTGKLPWLVSILIVWRRLKKFTFTEIGVFKGDTAVATITAAQKMGAGVSYLGFDLFENNKDFYKSHLDDFNRYNCHADAYWKFDSGEHTLDRVRAKLLDKLSPEHCCLVPGDSTLTVPEHLGQVFRSELIYIDGCHEYEIVKKDWENVKSVFDANPCAIVVFDDAHIPGVARLKEEILASDQFLLFYPNINQFFVVSRQTRQRDRWLFGFIEYYVALKQYLAMLLRSLRW